MNLEQNIIRLKSATNIILGCGDSVGLMREAVHQMYAVYCEYSSVNVSDQNDANIILTSGKAISPAAAAHCLLEMSRTTKFIRGIKQAIDEKLKTKEKVSILYAGTGPYAALVTPLLPFFVPGQVQVDLMDINSNSLQSALNIIKSLSLDSYVKDVYCVDASSCKVEKPYDVVISETMQAALKKEPQVAIMQNLIPQTPADSIFIPESITVSAALNSRGSWNAEIGQIENTQRIELGKIFTIDKQHLETELFRNELIVPGEINDCTQLGLYTDIQVYGTHALGENDCSLNIPLKLSEVNCSGGETLRFWYEQGEVPGIRFQIKGTEQVFEAIGRKDRREKPFSEGENKNQASGKVSHIGESTNFGYGKVSLVGEKANNSFGKLSPAGESANNPPDGFSPAGDEKTLVNEAYKN